MRTTRRSVLTVALALAASATVAAGQGSAAPAAAGALPAFAGCDALVAHMQALALPRVTAYGFPYGLTRREAGGGWMRPGPYGPDRSVSAAKAVDKAGVTVPAAGESAGAGGSNQKGNAASAAGAAVGPGGTGTNLQEHDVDEADIAKTDGDTVVSLRHGKLRVFTVADGRPKARGALALSNLTAHELLLSGDRVLVVGRMRDRGDARWHLLGLSLVDISDRDAPRLLGTQAITGSHVSTRMVDGVARVVLSSSPYLVFQGPGWRDDAERRAVARNRRIVRAAKAADWLPSRRSVAADGTLGPARPLVDCADVRRPADDSGFDLLSVLTVDLAGKGLIGRGNPVTSVVASGNLVYASADHLYVATTRRSRGFTPRTTVHSFGLADPRRTAYTGSGTVVGRMLGRWAMSEYGGDLRVVTTYPVDEAGRTETGIVVLRPRDGRLVPVGSTGGLGRGEQVYAVRWFDHLARPPAGRRPGPGRTWQLGPAGVLLRHLEPRHAFADGQRALRARLGLGGAARRAPVPLPPRPAYGGAARPDRPRPGLPAERGVQDVRHGRRPGRRSRQRRQHPCRGGVLAR